MKTNDVIQYNIDTLMEWLYSWLLSIGLYYHMPKDLKVLFKDVNKDDINLILNGIEEKYFANLADSKSYTCEGKIYWSIPYGELNDDIILEDGTICVDENPLDDFRYGEIKTVKEIIDKKDLSDWRIKGDFAFMRLPAIIVVYDINKVKEAIKDFKA